MKQQKQSARKRPWLLMAAGLLLVGCMLFFGSRIFRSIAVVCFGAAGVICAERFLLRLTARRNTIGRSLSMLFNLCLCVGLTVLVLTECAITTAGRGAPQADCPYVVVLGAGVNGQQPSLSLLERLKAAKTYLQEHPDAQCIVSGGQGRGEEISEAQCMYHWLTTNGIDPNRVWMEDQATNTQENLDFSLALIQEKTGQRPDALAIVSSDYHLYRAGLMAKRLGVEPLGVPAPTGRMDLRINYYLREIGGVWYFLLFG